MGVWEEPGDEWARGIKRHTDPMEDFEQRIEGEEETAEIIEGTAPVMLDGLKPGDLILTRSKRLPGWLIRLGAALQDKPNLVNHVIIAHHVDKAGVTWGIEGRPGGVGWVEITYAILDNPYTMTNIKQKKSDSERALICEGAKGLLGTEYSWAAIVGDGLDVLNLPNPWDHLWEEGAPAQVVCSSAADLLYWRAGLETPHNDENCTPGDWAEFFIREGWA